MNADAATDATSEPARVRMTALDSALTRSREEQEFRAVHPEAAQVVRYERSSWNSGPAAAAAESHDI